MARTIRRSPLTVSTSSRDYPTLQTFNHVEFKGISSGANELVIDQSSFVDANNVYVDKDYNLASRPPLKLCTNESGEHDGHIRTWTFGIHRVTYTRKVEKANGAESLPGTPAETPTNVYCYAPTAGVGMSVKKGHEYELVRDETIYAAGLGERARYYTLNGETMYEVYRLKFVFQFYINGEPLINLSRNILGIGFNTIPEANCALIGDKIFIWFAGTDFFCYDTSREELVEATNYIYTPIWKQVVNGFESELETKNFLTSAYKKRYQYSTLSDVNFNSLIGERVEVRLLGDARTDASAHLYDVVVDDNTERNLIYPYARLTDDFVDMVSTPRAQVFITYSSNVVGVSFDGKSFYTLPKITLLGKPLLSRDGLFVVGFVEDGFVIYRLDENIKNNTWEHTPYWQQARVSAGVLPDTTSVTNEPYGYFLDEENFVYVLNLGEGLHDKHIYVQRVVEGEKRWSLITSTNPWSFGGKCKFYLSPSQAKYVAFYNDENGPHLQLIKIRTFDEDSSAEVYSGSLTSQFTSIDIDKWDLTLNVYADGSPVVCLWIPYMYEDNYYIGFLRSESSFSRITHASASVVFEEESSLRIGERVFFGRFALELDGTYSEIPVHGENTRPIYSDGYSTWYFIDGELWTSQRTDDNTLLLDVTVSGENNFAVPDHWRELNEHYFVFNAKETGQNNRLEITQARKSEDGQDLLYLPEYNSQILANKMTNLWPLTDTIMGVFTEKELYYVGAVTADDARISYTKLMKSKTEIGCREGDEIVMSQDGQTILLPTRRGITAMQASALLDTSTQSLSYLSDPIAHIYEEFYAVPVTSFAPDTVEGDLLVYDPAVKILLYGQLILFYKYLAKDILVFDTRNGSWWKWTVPYPIRQLQVADHDGVYSLIAHMQIDYSIYEYGKRIQSERYGYIPSRISTLGQAFVFDQNAAVYQDELVPGALLDINVLSDDFTKIKWHVTSQRLHFDAINNYKCIKSLGLMAKGNGLLELKLQTKAYRDFYHPEYSNLFEFNINEQRTFFRKTNMMHLTNFQYTLSDVDDDDVNIPLSVNSICIKYEVKEAIR